MARRALSSTKVGLLSVLCVIFSSSCTKKEEGVTLVEALKRFPLRGTTIETAVKRKIDRLRGQGKEATETWTYQKIDQNTYTIRAEIGLAGANRLLDAFQWDMRKKQVPDYIRSEPWVVSKTNPSAQKLME